MAYKDEYEVARLHAEHTLAQVGSQVAGENLRLEFHLAPPLLAPAAIPGDRWFRARCRSGRGC